jgi:sarcosine oxidase subunit beta
MTNHEFDAVVIGGGLHGLSAALHLSRAGRKVVVLERAWVGRHASGASAAGVRTLGRPPQEVELTLQAMRMWHEIADLVGDDCGFHAHGQIRVAENDADMAKLEQRLALMHGLGYHHEELIDRAELRRLVPALAHHCVAAMIVRDNGAADPHRTLTAFRRSVEDAGAQIREGHGVESIERSAERWAVHAGGARYVAPFVVNCAGAWAGRVAAMVGDVIPLGTKASMMIVTERVEPMVEPTVGSFGRPLSFKQTNKGTLLIGGGRQGAFDLDKETAAVNLVELATAARTACELFPSIGDIRITRTWAGLEAATSDQLPIIGPSPTAPGVIHVFGFTGHGFQLVPVTGAVVTDLVVRGHTERPIGELTAERLMAQREAA